MPRVSSLARFFHNPDCIATADNVHTLPSPHTITSKFASTNVSNSLSDEPAKNQEKAESDMSMDVEIPPDEWQTIIHKNHF